MTNPLRTAIDIAATEDDDVIDEYLERGIAARLFGPDALLAEAERLACRGRRGIRSLHRALARRGYAGSPSPSELERRARRLFADHGIVVLAVEVRVLDGRYRIDFVLSGGLGVEVLGYRWHSSPEALASDTARSNRLLIAGRRSLQFTWFDIVTRPGHVAATIAAAQRTLATGPRRPTTAKPQGSPS